MIVKKFNDFIFFTMGFFSIIDWLPFVQPSNLIILRNVVIVFFVILLIFGAKINRINKISISILILSLFIFIRTIFSGNIPDQEYLNGFLLFIILIQDNINFKAILNGFLLSGYCNIVYMLSVDFEFLTVNRSFGEIVNEYGDWFVESNLVSIGLLNKYNRLSYLFSIFLFFHLKKYNRILLLNIIIILVVLYCQLLTGGRGGIYCSLLFIFFYYFKNLNFINITFFIFSVILLIVYIEPIFQALDQYRAIDLVNRSTQSRIFQFNYALENFDKNFWFGIGYQPLMSFQTPFSYIHNFFLNNLLMGGVFAFFLSLRFVWDLFYIVIKKFQKNDMIFLLVLFVFQLFVENFNLISVIGSYLVVWSFLTKKNNSHENWSNHSFLQ